MKRIRWIKGPMEGDGSRFAVLTEPIGSGSRNPGDRDGICNANAGNRRGYRANETSAHTPYVSLSIAGARPPCRATTHGYVRLFRYADDPTERTRRPERGSDGDGEGGTPLTLALFFARDEANVNRA